MIKQYISENNSKKSKAIKNIYYSFRNLNKTSLENNIKKVVKEIDTYRENNNLFKFLAHINSNEVVSFMYQFIGIFYQMIKMHLIMLRF